VVRIWLVALVIAALLFVVGLLGAAAFNPDDGVLAHSEPLWRLFGITAYLGLAAGYLLPILAVGWLIFLLVRRSGRHRSGTA
jgi:amino acid transporter